MLAQCWHNSTQSKALLCRQRRRSSVERERRPSKVLRVSVQPTWLPNLDPLSVFVFVFVIVFVFLLGEVWLEREVGYRQSMLAIWGQMEHKTITVMVNTTLACHHIRSASHNAILVSLLSLALDNGNSIKFNGANFKLIKHIYTVATHFKREKRPVLYQFEQFNP